jgi:xylulose-5-phosphate/fructose-6-phosphate phosphoketolase
VDDTEALDVDLSPDGRVLELLSEHLCEDYPLSGRDGLFSC